MQKTEGILLVLLLFNLFELVDYFRHAVLVCPTDSKDIGVYVYVIQQRRKAEI